MALIDALLLDAYRMNIRVGYRTDGFAGRRAAMHSPSPPLEERVGERMPWFLTALGSPVWLRLRCAELVCCPAPCPFLLIPQSSKVFKLFHFW